MKKKNAQSAFSLIELSIVIVVIGLLILGIAKGTQIIYQARLKSARALTDGAPVGATAGLKLWLETTTSKSFNGDSNSQSMPQDGDLISTWYDINPQDIQRTATSSNQPVFEKTGINNLPSLSFDGTKYITIGANNVLNSNSYSIFIVEQRSSASSMGIFGATFTGMAVYYSTSDLTFRHFVSNGAGGSDWIPIVDSSFSNLVPRVISATFAGPLASNRLKVYANGVLKSNSTRSGVVSGGQYSVGQNYNGVGNKYNGYISEVIFFDRFLGDAERHAIEAYLGSKWNVAMSSQ